MTKPIFNAAGLPVAGETSEEGSPFFDFEPMHGFVYVEKIYVSNIKTAGGILVPNNINEKTAVFRVVAVGPGYLDPTTGIRQPMSCAVGDYVLIDLGRMVNVAYAGVKEILVVQDADVYGRVKFRKDIKQLE